MASGNASSETPPVDGTSQTVYAALLSWPGTLLRDSGEFIVNPPNSYKHVDGAGDADWVAFVPKLIDLSKAQKRLECRNGSLCHTRRRNGGVGDLFRR